MPTSNSVDQLTQAMLEQGLITTEQAQQTIWGQNIGISGQLSNPGSANIRTDIKSDTMIPEGSRTSVYRTRTGGRRCFGVVNAE